MPSRNKEMIRNWYVESKRVLERRIAKIQLEIKMIDLIINALDEK